MSEVSYIRESLRQAVYEEMLEWNNEGKMDVNQVIADHIAVRVIEEAIFLLRTCLEG